MKKILIGLVALSMLTIVSCKKSAKVDGGSWTFKSVTYSVTSAIANSTGDQSLVAISNSNNNYDELQFTFYTLPTTSGQYTVTAGAPDTTNTQVNVNMILTSGSTYTGPTYAPDPSANVTAQVTVSDGKLQITLPSLNMINVKDSTDHGTVTATIKQTRATM